MSMRIKFIIDVNKVVNDLSINYLFIIVLHM